MELDVENVSEGDCLFGFALDDHGIAVGVVPEKDGVNFRKVCRKRVLVFFKGLMSIDPANATDAAPQRASATVNFFMAAPYWMNLICLVVLLLPAWISAR